MTTVVAVAGGSSGLGRAIVDALRADGRYEVLIFSRAENPQVEKESGARVLAADYSSVDALTTLLETNNVEVLITTANTTVDPTPEFNMIEAAARSRATKRFIPNAWSALQFTDEPRFKNFPLAQGKLQSLARLNNTDLDWTAIYPGLFMEYVTEGLPTTLTLMTIMLDMKHNAAALPNKGDAKITLTYSRDIAKYISKLLTLSTWERAYFIVGDVKSWNEIVAAAETGKGVKFDVTYDAVEKLKHGQVTELPGYARMYELFGGRDIALPRVQGLIAQYGLWMEEGIFTYQGGARLNDLFPEVEVLGLEGAWRVAGGKA
ncbi:NAD(P)-binding protein [Karstenula rhodostoma CBS 690.94]|uniref:NAD(P)-binding protein n=1 Tax=Karstenula rhodostoma CBS 690.94 TaxID=1392251 RepID=A0A9P4PTT9_9PLEO|nr:NAD(P)-binding protein [Karstenula rhodostoma CBS 690.94]